MAKDKSDVLQGTLDLMALKRLDAMGAMLGYGLAKRIEQIREDALRVNQGTIYLCLARLVNSGGFQPRGAHRRIISGRNFIPLRNTDVNSSPPKPLIGSGFRASSDACCGSRAGSK